MGYSTNFEGTLFFTEDLTPEGVVELSEFLNGDACDYFATIFFDLNLEMSECKGLKWDGSEKTHNLTEKVNCVIDYMWSKGHSSFGLKGKLVAQGEEVGDIWMLTIENGEAVRKEIEIIEKGVCITCPQCGENFAYKEE